MCTILYRRWGTKAQSNWVTSPSSPLPCQKGKLKPKPKSDLSPPSRPGKDPRYQVNRGKKRQGIMSECKMLVEGRGSVLVFTTEVSGGALVRGSSRELQFFASQHRKNSARGKWLIRSDLLESNAGETYKQVGERVCPEKLVATASPSKEVWRGKKTTFFLHSE